MSKTNHCIECNKLIWYGSKRCKSCENTRRWNDNILREVYLNTVKGKNNPNFGNLGNKNGIFKGKTKTLKGYITIYAPYHPGWASKNYMEHRAVMEAYINHISIKQWLKYAQMDKFPKTFKFLKKKEVVHHINGIKDDNRIKNLMLFANTKDHQQFMHFGNDKFICKYCNKDQRKC